MTGTPLLFGLAMAVLLLAHVLRAARHALLFPAKDVPHRFDLLLGLSLAYAINVIVPFRIGELARIVYIAVKMKLRVSYVAATVVAERFSDLIAVAIFIAVLPLLGVEQLGTALLRAGILVAIASLFIAFAWKVVRSERSRRWLWYGASIFNERIALGLVDFVWSTAKLVHDRVLLTRRYLALTLVMWSVYFAAYMLFAIAFDRSLSEISLVLLGAPLRSLLEEPTRVNTALLAFTSVPVVAILIYGVLHDRSHIVRSIAFAWRFGIHPPGMPSPTMSEAFRDTADYGQFLKAHFRATDSTVSNFGAHGVGDAIIHRMLPGGSEALTAVVEVDNKFSIRKFAIAGAADKLAVQADWLRSYRDKLPLTHVISDRRSGSSYRYDMDYLSSARDFYEVIHTAPLATSKAVLTAVVEQMSKFHDGHRLEDASSAIVDEYLVKKVAGNAREILDYARLQLDEDYTINGEHYALSDWEKLSNLDWLRAQIRTLDTTVIHGDLTVENIIVCPDQPFGWYIIDPNPENIFQSPMIDWSKMMQSLHLGYEGLNRGGSSQIKGNNINVLFARSRAYSELHDEFQKLLTTNLIPNQIREIAFHELVNYLRLTPYKIKRAPEKALTFFASTSVLLHNYERSAIA